MCVLSHWVAVTYSAWSVCKCPIYWNGLNMMLSSPWTSQQTYWSYLVSQYLIVFDFDLNPWSNLKAHPIPYVLITLVKVVFWKKVYYNIYKPGNCILLESTLALYCTITWRAQRPTIPGGHLTSKQDGWLEEPGVPLTRYAGRTGPGVGEHPRDGDSVEIWALLSAVKLIQIISRFINFSG